MLWEPLNPMSRTNKTLLT